MKDRAASPVAAILLVLTTGSVRLAAQTPDTAAAQADPFLVRAESALSAGNAGAAERLVQSAVELAPGDSEALFLLARIVQGDQERTAQCVSDLRAAIKAGTWRRTDPSEAVVALAGVLLRTGRASDARALIEPLTRSSPQDYRPLLMLARCQLAAGDPTGGDRTLGEAAARFPLVDEVRLAYARRLDALGRRAAGLATISTGLALHPGSLPLLLAAAEMETPGRRVAAIEAYVGKGGKDPLAPLLGMEASAQNRQSYLSLFLEDGGLASEALTERAASVVKTSSALTRTLEDALASWTGNRDLDRNDDGFWEERWVFERGVLQRWIREPAQDGAAVLSVSFSAGVPATVIWTAGPGATYSATYAPYPFVASVTQPAGGTLLLDPRAVRFDLGFRAPSLAGLAPRLAARPVAPRPADLQLSAYRREEYAGDGTTLLRWTILSRGLPLYTEEAPDSDGRMSHRIWYAGGQPVRGEQSMPGDSVARETWRGGKVVLTEWDLDGDGKVDYRETPGPSWVRSWDYNEDGVADSREYAGPGGTVVRELSTRLNGVFDVRVVYRGDRIESVTRGGSRLEAIADPARGVTWIGGPAADGARPDPSVPEGLQTIGGREYFVFSRDGVVYAEATH